MFLRRRSLLVLALVALALGITAVRLGRGVWPAVLPPPVPITAIFPSAPALQELATPGKSPKPPSPLTIAPGFEMTLYASGLKKPRVLALDSRSTPLVSDPEAGMVFLLPDDNDDGVADAVTPLLQNLKRPHGLAFRGDELFVATEDRVLRYPYDPGKRTVGSPRKVLDLPSGGSHWTRTIVFGPDGMLYVAIGSSCNVCQENDERRAAILRVNLETGKTERWAWGLRNTVFFTFHPQTGKMVGNDMGRDFLGDDLPPDELNSITGGDHGWPFCYGKQTPDPFGKHPQGCAATRPSLFDYPAHVAPLGLRFIPSSFAPRYAGDLLVSLHGSWNRSAPVGYKIVRLVMDGDRVVAMKDFLTGFLDRSANRAIGRPVDLLFTPDDSLLVSDDHAGAVYRVMPTPP